MQKPKPLVTSNEAVFRWTLNTTTIENSDPIFITRKLRAINDRVMGHFRKWTHCLLQLIINKQTKKKPVSSTGLKINGSIKKIRNFSQDFYFYL